MLGPCRPGPLHPPWQLCISRQQVLSQESSFLGWENPASITHHPTATAGHRKQGQANSSLGCFITPSLPPNPGASHRGGQSPEPRAQSHCSQWAGTSFLLLLFPGTRVVAPTHGPFLPHHLPEIQANTPSTPEAECRESLFAFSYKIAALPSRKLW